jgi:hypothetical protein
MTERGVEREGVGASGLPGPGETPVWRRLAEGLLLAYLLTLPGGMLVPGWVRAPLLYGVIVAGVLDAGLGSRRARVRGLLSAGLFFGVHALTIVTSEHRDLSLGLSVFTPVVALVFVVDPARAGVARGDRSVVRLPGPDRRGGLGRRVLPGGLPLEPAADGGSSRPGTGSARRSRTPTTSWSCRCCCPSRGSGCARAGGGG